MRRSGIILSIVIVGVSIYALSAVLGGSPTDTQAPVFHARLADEALYGEDGVYDTTAYAEAGSYMLRFVPNGDSPRTLSVSISGDMTSFLETFELFGTRKGTESATYYTWEYLGEKDVIVGTDTPLQVRIDPHGELRGSVSVTLIPK